MSPVALILANLTVVVRPLSVFAGGMWAVRSGFGPAHAAATP
jgi:hypothetical protein